MATKKELLERKAKLAGEIRRIGDAITEKDELGKERGFKDAEQREKWKTVNTDYNAVVAEIAEIEDQESVRTRIAELEDDSRERERRQDPRYERGDDRPTDEDRCTAIQAWLLHPTGEVEDRHADACRRLKFNPASRALNLGMCSTRDVRLAQSAMRQAHQRHRMERATEVLEQRNLSVSVGAKGGFTVPQGMARTLEVNMLAYGGMLQVADIWRTEKGDETPWPTVDDTSNEGVQVGEAASIGSSVDPTFGVKMFGAHKFSSRVIKVSSELLEDSALDLAEVIGQMAGERLGRVSNRKFTTGTGAGTPKGITLASTVGVTATSSTAIAADELLALVHSVDPAYRSGPGAGWMMHDNILLSIRQLKDGNGQYLWQPGLRAGEPDVLLNHPYTINQHMSSTITSGDITVEFGALNKYKVRQVRGVRLRRLDELYAETDEVAFIAYIRQDGDLLDAGTAPVKHIVQG